MLPLHATFTLPAKRLRTFHPQQLSINSAPFVTSSSPRNALITLLKTVVLALDLECNLKS